MSKRIVCAVLCAVLVLSCTPLSGFAASTIVSGEWGDVSWAIYENAYSEWISPSGEVCGEDEPGAEERVAAELVIRGPGEIPDAPRTSEEEGYNPIRPWNDYDIAVVRVEDGITRIGSCAFGGFDLREVYLPSTLLEIGSEAFSA
ncbi:MAG: leucine-rich repeat domain-containing protein, partial [Clostridia bacterium]|nr:leucine-rich repeat domain-containing protein [Clostridia bacterium]